MKRLRLLPTVLFLCLLLAGCRTLQLKGPVDVAEGDWWTTGGAPDRNAVSGEALDVPLREAWSYNALAGFGTGSALVIGDNILVANLQGEVHAIDLESGKRKGQINFRDGIAGTPAVDQGVLVVGKSWGKRSMQAYDLERAVSLWRRDGPRIEASLLPIGDHVLAADMNGGLHVVDVQTGGQRWAWQDPNNIPVHAAPLFADSVVVVASRDGVVRGFEPGTGQLKWISELGSPVYADPAASDGIVYVPSTQGTLFAIRVRTGRVLWRYSTQSTDVKIAAPSIHDGVIYFGASDGYVRAISTQYGEVVWRAQLEAAVTAPVVVAGHLVFAGTMQNRLVALEAASGTEVWSTELKGRIKSAMALAGGGLVVLSEPRAVSLYVPEEEPHVSH